MHDGFTNIDEEFLTAWNLEAIVCTRLLTMVSCEFYGRLRDPNRQQGEVAGGQQGW